MTMTAAAATGSDNTGHCHGRQAEQPDAAEAGKRECQRGKERREGTRTKKGNERIAAVVSQHALDSGQVPAGSR